MEETSKKDANSKMKTYANGILLDANTDANNVADAILMLLRLDKKELTQMGMASETIWKRKFNAEHNAKQFADSIDELGENRIRRIVIVTRGFPYGKEVPFIMSEVCELIKRFDLILVAEAADDLTNNNEETMREVVNTIQSVARKSDNPHSLTVLHTSISRKPLQYLPYIWRYLFDERICKERKSLHGESIKKKWASATYYSKAFVFSRWLERRIDFNEDPSETLIYTYWQLYTTLSACFIAKKYSGVRTITRAHGFDLYDEREEKCERQPFRIEMNSQLSRVYFISCMGRDYYCKRNKLPYDLALCRVGYLGSRPPELIKNVSEDNTIFRIVSCSSIIQIKRIELIIEAIRIIAPKIMGCKKTYNRIEWIHFGDGALGLSVRRIASQVFERIDNVSFYFMGEVSNSKIHRYYSQHRIDCFITTSSTEGLSVSVMEAMSYSIPIICTNVGGMIECFGLEGDINNENSIRDARICN